MAIEAMQVVDLQDSLLVFDGDDKYGHKIGSFTFRKGDLVELKGVSINPVSFKIKIINKNIEGWISTSDINILLKKLNVEYLYSYDLVFNREVILSRYQGGHNLGTFTFGTGSKIRITGSSKKDNQIMLTYKDGGIEYQLDYYKVVDEIFGGYISATKYDYANSPERALKLGLAIGGIALVAWMVFKK